MGHGILRGKVGGSCDCRDPLKEKVGGEENGGWRPMMSVAAW